MNSEFSSLEQEFERYAGLLRALERGLAKMPAELVQTIAAVKNAIDSVNVIKKYVEGIQDVQRRGELMQAIGELNVKLANAQIQLAQQLTSNNELLQENERLKRENADLRNPQVNLLFKDGFYYKDNGDGPFCTHCYDTKRLCVRLPEPVIPATGILYCPSCKVSFRQPRAY